jgi:phosphoribosylformylglycinamidine cyclo-ligase
MGLTYENSGVSIDRGNLFVERIKAIIGDSPQPGVVGGIGGFSGLYRLDGKTLLAACCDGVGTKMEIAKACGHLEFLGQDLVAMSVNDLVTCGARPLFFLDYLACGHLDIDAYEPVVRSIHEACRESGCALLGGETAEMPGVYPEDGFDLAGFAAGIVKETDLIDGKDIKPKDLVVGLSSSGLHSNGFSLVRKALLDGNEKDILSTIPPGCEEPLWRLLLTPTKLYVRSAMKATSTGVVKGMAHITGGGLEENITRVLPKGLKLQIDFEAWTSGPVFSLLRDAGVPEEEMRRVFNLGIGYVFIVAPEGLEELVTALESEGETPLLIGEIL